MENNNIRVWNNTRERSVNNDSFSFADELFQNCTGVSKKSVVRRIVLRRLWASAYLALTAVFFISASQKTSMFGGIIKSVH